MKIISILAGLLAVGALSAEAETWTVSSGEQIPDYPDSGLLSTFDITGSDPQLAGNSNPLLNQILSLQLDISGGWNGDYNVTLFHVLPDNSIQSVTLFNQVGVNGTHPDGFENAGMDVSLVAGQPDIQIYGGSYTDMSVLTGIYGLGGGADYSIFTDSSLLGTWGLHLTDESGGDTGTLVSWTMSINVVPEPTSLFGIGLLIFGVHHLWRRHQRA